MTFTKRIRENCLDSTVKHCVAITVEGLFLAYLKTLEPFGDPRRTAGFHR